jgi:nitrite reductase/ring-hydroxylating ferredoxin subunit
MEPHDAPGPAWTRVARLEQLEQLPDPGGIHVDVEGRELFLVRAGPRVSAVDARCPHAGQRIGLVHESGCAVVCAAHGWAFDLTTGRHLQFRAGGIRVFRTRVWRTDVYVKTGLLRAFWRRLSRRTARIAERQS